MAVVAPLLYRGRTRLGWALTAVVTGVFALASLWPVVSAEGGVIGSVVAAGLALGYGWVALGALRLALARRAYVAVRDDALVVVHAGVLGEPLVLRRGAVDEVEVDPRPARDRSAAAGLRRGGVAPPTFLAPDLPVVSAAPSAHSDSGTAVVPNLVVRFTEPLPVPPPPLAVRLLLRLALGRNGRYRGPAPRRTYDAVRLVVEGVEDAADALGRWEPLDVEPRDDRYLAEVTEEHHRRHRRNRLLVACGVSVIVMVFGALELLSRT